MAGNGSVSVEVKGLREFRAKLRRLDGNANAAGRDASRRAAEMVVAHAKPRIPVGPARNGHVRATLRVDEVGSRSYVRAGDEAHPYYPWLDFGGRVGIRNSVHRPYIKSGRYIYPAYSAVLPRIKEVMDEELREAAHRAGLETH